MSRFSRISATCPKCSHAFEMDAVDSVNADRRSDLRDEILDESFQVVTCPECETEFRLAPRLNYLDVGRGQFVAALEPDRVYDWVEEEDMATKVFAEAYGERAGSAAREIGEALTARLVFGWPALREKIVLNELGLNDVTVELMKLALIRGLDGIPIKAGVDLRVLSGVGSELTVARQDATTGEVIEEFYVPRSIYDDIDTDREKWGDPALQLGNGPFVDIQKLYFGEAPAQPS